jgi:rhodanese-related sulfurtransferase
MDTQTRRRFKDQLYGQFARIPKALANAHRLELLDLLALRERSVDELARESGMSVANTSQHLQILHAAQLLDIRRVGTFVRYRLADERVFQVWQSIRDLGATRLAEIERLVTNTLHMRPVSAPIEGAELLKRLRDGAAVLLDVRPVEEYGAGHIPGAWSMPLAELDARTTELPQDQEIITCCRGPYGPLADEAAARLRAQGYRARPLALDMPDWRALGLPLETQRGVSEHDQH